MDERATQVRKAIGEKLKLLRRERGLTLQEAADSARLSRSFVQMVESGSSEIAVTRLVRLADVYGMTIADLFDGIQDAAIEFTAADDALEVPDGSEGVRLRYLTGPAWTMQAFSLELQPGGRIDLVRHAGDEFMHCIKGKVQMRVDNRDFELNEGDTIVIPENAEHTYANVGSDDAVLVGAVLRLERQSPVKRPHG